MAPARKQHELATPHHAAAVFATALWHEIITRLPLLWVMCMVAMAGVQFTAVVTVFGTAGFKADVPLPLAIRRTMLVLLPAGVTAIALVGLLLLTLAGHAIDPVRLMVRHIRRATLSFGIAGAWCSFPATYTLGPAAGLLCASIGSFAALLVYRHIVLAPSRQLRSTPPAPYPPISAIDEMFLDADQ